MSARKLCPQSRPAAQNLFRPLAKQSNFLLQHCTFCEYKPGLQFRLKCRGTDLNWLFQMLKDIGFCSKFGSEHRILANKSQFGETNTTSKGNANYTNTKCALTESIRCLVYSVPSCSWFLLSSNKIDLEIC